MLVIPAQAGIQVSLQWFAIQMPTAQLDSRLRGNGELEILMRNEQ